MHTTDLPLLTLRLSAVRRIRGLFTALVLLFLAACGSAPVQEMSEARQAIEAARVAGAEQHAPADFDKAQTFLKSAEDLLNDRHFRKARESAALARDRAIKAREAAQQATGQ